MVQSRLFGTTRNGVPVHAYTITNGALSATILDYGVTVQSLVFSGVDVACGYDTLNGYETNDGYVGATVGRYANRLADGRLPLNGREYVLACNDTDHRCHLHGGHVGFDRQCWTATVTDDETVCFSRSFADGEEGYPGRLDMTVTIRVTDDSALSLRYHAVSDQDTVINVTNHTYFNLNGWDGGDVLNHELTVRADYITPVTAQLIPTGEYLPVEHTPFDFRVAKPLGADMAQPHPQLVFGNGYDHNFVLTKSAENQPSLILHSPRTGITLSCFTDQPGVQIYTANFLKATEGKGGLPLYPRQGVCLETQHFPDSPHHPSFPSTELRAGTSFDSTTLYRFC